MYDIICSVYFLCEYFVGKIDQIRSEFGKIDQIRSEFDTKIGIDAAPDRVASVTRSATLADFYRAMMFLIDEFLPMCLI